MASAAATKVDQLPVRAARPAISIDGNRQTELEARLVSYALTDSLDGMARAELCFGNWGGSNSPGFQYFDRSIPRRRPPKFASMQKTVCRPCA